MSNKDKHIAIIGGGLAGITAAAEAVKKGYHVSLFERSCVLGGRVASLFEPVVKEYIDTGQHIFLDSCSRLISLHNSLGLSRFFKSYSAVPFAGSGEKRWTFKPARWLPKSWQFLPAMLSMPFLPFSERLAVCRLLDKLLGANSPTGTVSEYLAANRVSADAVTYFWQPLVLSMLSETPKNASLLAARQILQRTCRAGLKVFIPTVPLRSVYHNVTSAALTDRGIDLRFLTRVKRLHWEQDFETNRQKITAIELADGSTETFDQYVFAVPFYNLWKILADSDLDDYAHELGLGNFELGAITTVHLWLDEPLLKPALPFSVLAGGYGQFICCPNSEPNKEFGYYHTVVISAAHRILDEQMLTVSGSGNLANLIVSELSSIFGKSSIRRNHYRVTTNFEAVFSPNPAIFVQRPAAITPFDNMTLASDWTQTGFSSTMEGAVISGIQAVSGEVLH